MSITVIFDNECANWSDNPQYNHLFIQTQINWAKDQLRARGHLFLNEFYDMLGLPRSPQGQLEGWLLKDGDHTELMRWDEDPTDPNTIELKIDVDGVIYDKI